MYFFKQSVNYSISDKILKLADVIYQKACDVTVCNENECSVLNHGDFWINNMLFKYNEQNRPIEHIFVSIHGNFF